MGTSVTGLSLAAALIAWVGCAKTDTAAHAPDAALADASPASDASPRDAGEDACLGITGGDPEDAATSTVERDESCNGADLYIATLRTCATCGGHTATVVIANRGTQAATYRLEASSEVLDGETALEPQAASEPHVLAIEPPVTTVRVIATGTTEDCDPTDNEREARAPYITCE